ncbi:MAG: hypothetical protein ABI859_04535 [Pseudomonadota bacterium]
MTSTQETLIKKFGVLLSYEQLAEVLQRRPDGLRLSLYTSKSDWAQRVCAARVKIGRRVLFDTAEIGKLIDEQRGRS